MHCPSCSRLIPPDAQFCAACGAALSARRPRSAWKRWPAAPVLVAGAFTLAVVFGVALVMARMPDLGAGAGALAALIFAALCAQWLWMDGRRAAGALAMLLWVLAVGCALA